MCNIFTFCEERKVGNFTVQLCLNFIICCTNYNPYVIINPEFNFISMNFFFYLSRWWWYPIGFFVLIMAASNCAMGTRRLKSVYKTIPFARRFSPFTFSELKVKFLFLAYNFSCRFRPRYLWQRLHSTKGDKKSHYLSVKITLQIYYDVILLSYHAVLVVHFPRCNAGNIRRRLLRLNWSN